MKKKRDNLSFRLHVLIKLDFVNEILRTEIAGS